MLHLTSRALFVAGVLALPSSIALIEGWLTRVICVGLSSVLLLVAAELHRRAKEAAQITAQQLLAADRRAPIVYLREFVRDDDRDLESEVFGISASLEENLVAALSAAGPVIALSRPGEHRTPVGAARYAVDGTAWKDHIDQWLTRSLAVVVLAGGSESLDWELRRCVEVLEPRQLLVVVPNAQQYERFRRLWLTISPSDLPESIGPSGLLSFGSAFQAKWLPDTTSRWQRANRAGAAQVLYQQNLRPFFNSLEVRYPTAERFGAALLRIALMVLTGVPRHVS